jgi:hypothetical protein
VAKIHEATILCNEYKHDILAYQGKANKHVLRLMRVVVTFGAWVCNLETYDCSTHVIYKSIKHLALSAIL